MSQAIAAFHHSRNLAYHFMQGLLLCIGFAFGAAAQPPDAAGRPTAYRHSIEYTQNASGWQQSTVLSGSIDRDNPFFSALGSNGRSCASCHRQAEGWSISAAGIRRRFTQSAGIAPVFRLVDGAVSPHADVSTLAARRRSYGMLLKYGVLRIGLPIPDNAEFRLAAVDDPYGYASAEELSLFRRPLPTTNLVWDTAVMWDGRFTASAFVPPMDIGMQLDDLASSLAIQARDAILGHEQSASAPPSELLARVVRFELGLFTAQSFDDRAGRLNADNARGGADILSQQRFWVGINDPLGADPAGLPFDSTSMRLFDRWQPDPGRWPGRSDRPARRAIARGEQVFNSLPFDIRGVAGLNDLTGQAVIQGTCSTCHNAPNIGNHSLSLPIDIGIADADRRTPDLPLYTLINKRTGERRQTTDPGLALITGRWDDIGKFKGPILRGLAARAPYFHNGSAATIEDVLDFYDQRFAIGLDAQQKSDLAAFLKAL